MSEVRNCENTSWDALCQSGSALLPHLAKDCVMLFPGGMMLSDENLRSTLSGGMFQPWKTYTITDDRVLPLNNDSSSALVVYRVTAEREIGGGEPKLVFCALCSSVWRRRTDEGELGKWEMVFHQQTPI